MAMQWQKYLPAIVHSRLAGRDGLKRTAANAGWLFSDQIVRMGVGLVVSVWVARYLGPAQFGNYSYALAFVMLFSVLATLGLDGIVVRDLVREPGCKEETLGTAFFLKLAGGALTVLLTAAIIALLRPDDKLLRTMVGIVAVGTMFQSCDVIDFWFQSQVKSKYSVYAKNGAFLLLAVTKAVMIMSRAPLLAFVVAGVAETALAAVGLIITYRKQGNCITFFRFSGTRAKSLLTDSWPLILTNLAIFLQARFDQVMLGEMLGAREVGQFSAAMKLIEVFGFVPTVIYSSVAPAITSAKLQGEGCYQERLTNVYRLMFVLFIVTALPIFLFSERIVVLLYGPEYRQAGVLLSLFAVRLFFTNFGVAKSLFITNENLFRYALITSCSGAVLNVTLNYLLIPRYASVGAIWAMIVSFAVTTFIMDIFFARTRFNLALIGRALATPWQLRFR